jgi:hypothetical protein
VLEHRVDLACEVSVIVARDAQRRCAAWPVVIHSYGDKIKYSTGNTGATVEFDFIGTGFTTEFQRLSGNYKFNIEVDGVNVGLVNAVGSISKLSGQVLCAKGLSYGKHHAIITPDASNNSQFRVGSIFIFDETRLERPRIQRELAKVGDSVVYHVPFTTKPFLKVFGNGVYSTSETNAGFTVSGTDGALVEWEAEGNLIAY